MKILSSINAFEELDALCDAGADELYCGIFQKGEFSHCNSALNRREGLTFCLNGYEEFERVCWAASERRVPVHLALNSFYSESAFLKVKEQIDHVLPLDPQGIIAADISVIRHLREIGYRGCISISVGGTVFNPEAVAFYRELGADRVVLPRHLTIKEVGAFADMPVELEIILLEDRCLFVDGFCNFHHTFPSASFLDFSSNLFLSRKAFPWVLEHLNLGKSRKTVRRILGDKANQFRRVCSYRYDISPSAPGKGSPPSEAMLEKLASLLSEHTHVGTCGLCQLPALEKIGIRTIKIANRGKSTAQKIRTIRLARNAISAMQETTDPGAYTDRVRGSFRALYGQPCGPGNCYFPEG